MDSLIQLGAAKPAARLKGDRMTIERFSRTGTTGTQFESEGLLKSAPLPREHGAWVMLLLPLLVGGVLGGHPGDMRLLELAGAAFLAFAARNAASLFWRRRSNIIAGCWTILYGIFALLLGLPLVAGPSGDAASMRLLALAVLPSLALFTLFVIVKPRSRFDRTTVGEIVGVAALTATGPAAYLISSGRLDRSAILLWAVNFIYYSGGVVYVKMRLDAMKHRADWTQPTKFATGYLNLVLTLFVGAGVFVLAVEWPAHGMLMAVAFAPALTRGLIGWVLLKPALPRLKYLGIAEATIALWFSLFLVFALRGT